MWTSKPRKIVDVVLPAAKLTEYFDSESFDVAISTELLEHVTPVKLSTSYPFHFDVLTNQSLTWKTIESTKIKVFIRIGSSAYHVLTARALRDFLLTILATLTLKETTL